MQYCALELDDESKDLCTIVTPFGKYRYRRLLMGFKISANVAQSIMEQILGDLDFEVYINDIAIFQKTMISTWKKRILFYNDWRPQDLKSILWNVSGVLQRLTF